MMQPIQGNLQRQSYNTALKGSSVREPQIAHIQQKRLCSNVVRTARFDDAYLKIHQIWKDSDKANDAPWITA